MVAGDGAGAGTRRKVSVAEGFVVGRERRMYGRWR
jgi:hypothetical protein